VTKGTVCDVTEISEQNCQVMDMKRFSRQSVDVLNPFVGCQKKISLK
jgi:hypothetical protein